MFFLFLRNASCNTVLKGSINLMLSLQIIFKGLQNFKRIVKDLGLCANRDIQFMGFCLPLARGDLVDDGVLVEVGGTVVLLEGVVDLPGKRITFIGGRSVTGRRVLMCLLSSVPPLPSSPLLTHPGDIINNYSTSLHWVCHCPASYKAYSAELVLTIFENGSYFENDANVKTECIKYVRKSLSMSKRSQ